MLQNVSRDSFSGTVNNYLQHMSKHNEVVLELSGDTDLVLRPFAANDLPYDLTDLETTS